MPRIRDIATERLLGALTRADILVGDLGGGNTFKVTLGSLQDFIIASTGAGTIYVPMFFFGNFVVGQAFGRWQAPFACDVIGVDHNAQVAPVGQDAGFDLVDENGDTYGKASALAAGALYQKTTFGSALELSANDYVQLKVTAKGTTTPGGYLTSRLIVQPRLS